MTLEMIKMQQQMARNMLNRGFSVQDTADITGLSEEQVQALAAVQ